MRVTRRARVVSSSAYTATEVALAAGVTGGVYPVEYPEKLVSSGVKVCKESW